MAIPLSSRPSAEGLAAPQPWRLPARGLAVFHGPEGAARLSHYFLPRLFLEDKRALILDGANSADPRLLERLARQRRLPFASFSRRIQIARAFTCFQLTELVARVPRLLEDFPAQALIVTALPELYYDEDVRDWDARVAFEQALGDLRRWAGRSDPLAVAVFSASPSAPPAGRAGDGHAPPGRRRFFPQLCAAATEVWEFSPGEGNRLKLSCARPQLTVREGRSARGRINSSPPLRRGDLWAERLPPFAS